MRLVLEDVALSLKKNLNLLHGYLKPKQILAESIFKTVEPAGRTIAFFYQKIYLN